MNLNTWLNNATTTLKDAGVPTARLDALVLLGDALQSDKAWILSHPEFEIDEVIIQTLKPQIGRRTTHEPLAYIRGRSEFYGREFIVTQATLQPRAETETMIDLLKKIELTRPVIADIGTGTGCIAITASLELQNADVYATDTSTTALEIANSNATRYNTQIKFHQGDLVEPLAALKLNPNVLLCNLPYVPNKYPINLAAKHEPNVALFGGEDGMDFYRTLFNQIKAFSLLPEYILTESLPMQHDRLINIAKQYGYNATQKQNYIVVFKKRS